MRERLNQSKPINPELEQAILKGKGEGMEKPKGRPINKELEKAIVMDLDVDMEKSREHPSEIREKILELQDKSFSEADDWTGLYAMIASKGSLKMGEAWHSPQDVIKIIDHIRDKKLDVNTITRSGGLRAKVIELLAQK